MNVAIIGASNKPDRFAYQAQQKLIDHGYLTFPVSVLGQPIMSRPGFRSVDDIPAESLPIHTVTVYLNPQGFAKVANQVLACAPKRIIFNPGTESTDIIQRFLDAGVEVVRDCTLIMLDRNEI